jgi:hypothetical protein
MDFAGFVVKLQAGDSSAIAAALVTAVAAVLVGAFLTDYFKLTSFVDASPKLRREESYDALQRMASEDPTKIKPEDKVLNPAVFKKFRLLASTKVSHNTKLLRFELPAGRTLGLSIGRHVSVRGNVRGTPVMRAYTPTSRPDTEGYFELMVRVAVGTQVWKHVGTRSSCFSTLPLPQVKTYEYGKLSPHLHSLVPGDTLEVRVRDRRALLPILPPSHPPPRPRPCLSPSCVVPRCCAGPRARGALQVHEEPVQTRRADRRRHRPHAVPTGAPSP